MSHHAVSFLPKSVVEVKLHISTDQIQQAYDKSLTKSVKSTQIHGFRKGKAPRSMVEAFVGKEKIYENALNTLIPGEFEKALIQEQEKSNQRLIVLEAPVYKIDEKWKPGEELGVTVTCVVYPKVDTSKLMQEIKLEKNKPADTSESEVDEAIDKIFEQYKKIKQKQADEKAKNVIENKDDNSKDKSGSENTQSTEVSVEKDDTFAKAAGAENMQALKDAIRKEIEHEKVMESERNFEEEVLKQAQKYVEIDIPDILINEELTRIEQRFKSQLERIGTTFEKYCEIENKTKQDLDNEWRGRAQENTIIALILQQIRIDKNIEVTEEEMSMFAYQNGLGKSISSKDANTIAYMIGQAKALDELKKQAQNNIDTKK